MDKAVPALHHVICDRCNGAFPRATHRQFDQCPRCHPQQGPIGLAAIIGKWPGDETDEEIEAVLKEMS